MVSTHHLRAWQARRDTKVVAIADPLEERARARASEFGIRAVYTDAEAMLDTEQPDALDIAAGHAAHAVLCAAAAARGIAVLCQKPLGPTLADARAIVSDVGTRARLMVHENWRFRPWYQEAARWVSEGLIGEPRRLALSTRSSGLVARDGGLPALIRQPMLATLPRLMIAEVLVHHLDVAGMLVGPLKVEAARTWHAVDAVRGESAARIDLSSAPVDVTVAGDFADATAGPSVVDAMQLEGTQGTLTLDAAILRARGVSSRERVFDLAAGYQQSYDGAIAHFADALRDDTPFATSPEVHLRVLAQMEAAYRLADGI